MKRSFFTTSFFIVCISAGSFTKTWAQSHSQAGKSKPATPATGAPATPASTTTGSSTGVPVGQTGVSPNGPLLYRSGDGNDTAIENRLVMLALRGPDYDGSEHQNRISELGLKQAKGTWLNLLSVSTQYNDQTFGKPTTVNGQPAYVYPKYFFGVTIPLGIIFSQGNQVKIAREAVANSKDQQEILARQIRANVLAKYAQYRYYGALIEMEGEMMNDVSVNSTQAEQNFKNGSITADAYIAAQKTKNDELVKVMNLQLQQDLTKIDLERMIGVSLETVVAPTRRSPRPTSN